MTVRALVTACSVSLLLALAVAVPRASPAPAAQSVPTQAALPTPPLPIESSLTPCPVTQPNQNTSPENGETRWVGGYGNDALWTNLWMLGEGTVVFEPGGSGFVLQDGAMGIKWAWYRHLPGELTIEGRRLDAPAPPLRADIPDGYGTSGFQVSALIFPTVGCWEVTGHIGNESISFIKLVERIGDGPNWRPDETSSR